MTTPESTTRSQRIVGLFPELLGTGGIQEAGRQTVVALDRIARRYGWYVQLLSLNDAPGAHALDAGGGTIPFQGFGRSKFQFVLAAMAQSRRDSRIVLAAHPHFALPAELMRAFSRNLKIIVMSHGVEVWKPLPSPRRRALSRADRVVAPSSDTIRKLADIQGVPLKIIRKLPWPLSSNFVGMADAPSGLPLPMVFPDGQIVLTVGRWAAAEHYKGADELIRAVSHLQGAFPGLHLVAAGGGDDLPRLQRMASDLGVADRVHFLDGLSRLGLAACYARCDVFSLPSRGEGFGLVFLEAMAFAKPLIGVSCGGTTDLIEDGINGLLVPPDHPDALVQALERLLRDERLRAELGKRGAEIVRRKYTFVSFELNLEKILNECGLEAVGVRVTQGDV